MEPNRENPVVINTLGKLTALQQFSIARTAFKGILKHIPQS